MVADFLLLISANIFAVALIVLYLVSALTSWSRVWRMSGSAVLAIATASHQLLVSYGCYQTDDIPVAFFYITVFLTNLVLCLIPVAASLVVLSIVIAILNFINRYTTIYIDLYRIPIIGRFTLRFERLKLQEARQEAARKEAHDRKLHPWLYVKEHLKTAQQDEQSVIDTNAQDLSSSTSFNANKGTSGSTNGPTGRIFGTDTSTSSANTRAILDNATRVLPKDPHSLGGSGTIFNQILTPQISGRREPVKATVPNYGTPVYVEPTPANAHEPKLVPNTQVPYSSSQTEGTGALAATSYTIDTPHHSYDEFRVRWDSFLEQDASGKTVRKSQQQRAFEAAQERRAAEAAWPNKTNQWNAQRAAEARALHAPGYMHNMAFDDPNMIFMAPDGSPYPTSVPRRSERDGTYTTADTAKEYLDSAFQTYLADDFPRPTLTELFHLRKKPNEEAARTAISAAAVAAKHDPHNAGIANDGSNMTFTVGVLKGAQGQEVTVEENAKRAQMNAAHLSLDLSSIARKNKTFTRQAQHYLSKGHKLFNTKSRFTDTQHISSSMLGSGLYSDLTHQQWGALDLSTVPSTLIANSDAPEAAATTVKDTNKAESKDSLAATAAAAAAAAAATAANMTINVDNNGTTVMGVRENVPAPKRGNFYSAKVAAEGNDAGPAAMASTATISADPSLSRISLWAKNKAQEEEEEEVNRNRAQASARARATREHHAQSLRERTKAIMGAAAVAAENAALSSASSGYVFTGYTAMGAADSGQTGGSGSNASIGGHGSKAKFNANASTDVGLGFRGYKGNDTDDTTENVQIYTSDKLEELEDPTLKQYHNYLLNKLIQGCKTLIRNCGYLICALSLIFALYNTAQIMILPDTKNVTVSLNVPVAFDGLRIVQISNLNIGPMFNRKKVADMVLKIMQMRPDIIVFTGDISIGEPWIRENTLKPLFMLNAPLGVYAVPGDRDYSMHFEHYLNMYDSHRFELLLNESRSIQYMGTKMNIIGIADESAAMNGVFLPSFDNISIDPDSHFNLILTHNPRNVRSYQTSGYHSSDLILSGNSLSSQFSFLDTITSHVNNGFLRGLYQLSPITMLYVSGGTGTDPMLPIRYGNHAELTLLTIHSTNAVHHKAPATTQPQAEPDRTISALEQAQALLSQQEQEVIEPFERPSFNYFYREDLK